MDDEQHHVRAGNLVSLEAWRLSFGEGGTVAGYCLPARTVAAIIVKVLLFPPGHYIDDFIATLPADDDTAADDLWEFLVDILKLVLQRKKFHFGRCLLYLGMEIRFSADGIHFVSENRRRKYVELLEKYFARDELLRPQASQLAGRLNWACNAPFGLCGHAFLSPILARAAHREARPQPNGGPVEALTWWKEWLCAPHGDLSRFVPAAPQVVGRPPVTYSGASTGFGLGGVLLLPATREAFWLCTCVPPGDPIDRLEVEAAAVVDALFGPLLDERGYTEEISFVDKNVSCPWVIRGRRRANADPMLSGLWMQMAICGGFKWLERVSSASIIADKPSRGIVPNCPCGWRLREVLGVARWERSDGSGLGRPWPAL